MELRKEENRFKSAISGCFFSTNKIRVDSSRQGRQVLRRSKISIFKVWEFRAITFVDNFSGEGEVLFFLRGRAFGSLSLSLSLGANQARVLNYDRCLLPSLFYFVTQARSRRTGGREGGPRREASQRRTLRLRD